MCINLTLIWRFKFLKMTQIYLRKLIAKEECLFCKTVAFLTADFGTRWKTLVDPLLLRKGESFGTNRCGPDVTYATTVKGKKTRQRHAACRRARAALTKPSRRRAFSARGQSIVADHRRASRRPCRAACCTTVSIFRWSSTSHRRSSIIDRWSRLSSWSSWISREFLLSQSDQFREQFVQRDDKESI